jgi:hypothetical protein
VSFQPSRLGTFHATLRIKFCDKTRPDDQKFIMTRELRGRAILPDGLASISEPRSTPEDMVGNKGTGITVSHDFGLEFLVERSSSGELFPTQTKELVITKSSLQPFVFFKGARVCLQGASVTR